MMRPPLLDRLAVRLLRLLLPGHEVRAYLSEVDEAAETRAAARRSTRRSRELLRLLGGLVVERLRGHPTAERRSATSTRIHDRLRGAPNIRLSRVRDAMRSE